MQSGEKLFGQVGVPTWVAELDGLDRVRVVALRPKLAEADDVENQWFGKLEKTTRHADERRSLGDLREQLPQRLPGLRARARESNVRRGAVGPHDGFVARPRQLLEPVIGQRRKSCSDLVGLADRLVACVGFLGAAPWDRPLARRPDPASGIRLRNFAIAKSPSKRKWEKRNEKQRNSADPPTRPSASRRARCTSRSPAWGSRSNACPVRSGPIQP